MHVGHRGGTHGRELIMMMHISHSCAQGGWPSAQSAVPAIRQHGDLQLQLYQGWSGAAGTCIPSYRSICVDAGSRPGSGVTISQVQLVSHKLLVRDRRRLRQFAGDNISAHARGWEP